MHIEDFKTMLQMRASHRKFSEEKVPEEDIKSIISVARYSPSGHNLQPWKVVAVSGATLLGAMTGEIRKTLQEINAKLPAEMVEKMEKYTFFIDHFESAPMVLAVLGREFDYISSDIEKKYNVPLPERKMFNMSLLGIGAFIENILLAAQLKGYGTCWMTEPVVYAQQKLEKVLNVEEPFHLVSLIAIGKPVKERKSAPKKEVEEILAFIEK